MSKQQWKLLVCSIAALTLLVMALFVSPWFDVNVLGTAVSIDLRTMTVCGLGNACATISISGFKGFYPIAATAAFFIGIPVLVLVVVQAASRIVTGAANMAVTKLGYAIAMIAMIAGIGAGFLFAPDSQGMDDMPLVVVSRTWAPVMFLVGSLLAMFSLYLAAVTNLDDNVAEYKPIKLEKHEHGRLPVTPLSVQRVPIAPHGSTPVSNDAARRFTPSGGVQRIDDNSKRYTPGGSRPLDEHGRPIDDNNKRYSVGDPNRRFTPSQQLQRVDESGRRFTPSQQIRQIDEAGRTKSPSQGPAVARTSSPGLRPSSQQIQRPGSDPNLGRSSRPGSDPNVRSQRAGSDPGASSRAPSEHDTGRSQRAPSEHDTGRSQRAQSEHDMGGRSQRAPSEHDLGGRSQRAPSEHGMDPVDVGSRVQHLPVDTGVDVRIKQRPPSDPSIEVVRLAPSTPQKRPSDPGLLDVRIKSPTQQPLVARTASPGVAEPRTKSPTSQPLVARTASPGVAAAEPRSKSPTSQPLVARTASPGVATDPRSKSASQQPLVAGTASPGVASLTGSKSSTQQPLLTDPRSKSASQQPLVARTSSPGVAPADPRSKSPSQQPLVARTSSPGVAPGEPRSKSPSQQPLSVDLVEKSRTSSSGPIDLASRLTAAAPQGVLEPLGLAGLALGPPGAALGHSASPVEVSIRPPLPQPERVPPDQIPVDPAAGLTIRKRTTSAVQMPVPPEVIAAQAKVDAAAAAATTPPPASKVTLSTFPPYIQNRINYAALTVELSTAGLMALREDGSVKTIAWDSIVGVIARRLPPDKPYEGATFVDIVSEAGATVRVVPWTRVRGGLPLAEAPVARAREIVNLVAAQALSAKLDAATKLFCDSDGQAAQLPTVATLGTHDEHVA